MKPQILMAMLTLLSLLAPQSVAGQGGSMVLGAGTASCGEWTKARRQQNSAYFFSWVLGYLSATNASVQEFTSDITATTDPEGLKAWIDNYCTQRPLDPLAKATGALVIELVSQSTHRKD